MQVGGDCKAELVVTGKDGSRKPETIHDFKAPGIIQGLHNTDKSIASFARACFNFALDQNRICGLLPRIPFLKNMTTASRISFRRSTTRNTRKNSKSLSIEYFYTLIDDAVARVIRSEGGYIWACKNYDGDVMSDMVATAFGSLAMMTSVLVAPDGTCEYEAAHGTVQRHY